MGAVLPYTPALKVDGLMFPTAPPDVPAKAAARRSLTAGSFAPPPDGGTTAPADMANEEDA